MILRGFIIAKPEGEATNLDTRVAERLYICTYTTSASCRGQWQHGCKSSMHISKCASRYKKNTTTIITLLIFLYYYNGILQLALYVCIYI